jgi:hypothetical protein
MVLPYPKGSSLYILVLFMVNVLGIFEFKSLFMKLRTIFLSYIFEVLLQVELKLFLGHEVGFFFFFLFFADFYGKRR